MSRYFPPLFVMFLGVVLMAASLLGQQKAELDRCAAKGDVCIARFEP